MHISLVGLNHSTTPVAIREKVTVGVEQLHNSLLLLRNYVPNGIILSTCNRTEVYAVDSHPVEEAIISFLNAITGISFADLLPHIYLHQNETAFRHLLRIASGLDSMIVGEYEVLGQVRQALTAAENAKMVNLPLRHISQSAIRVGRRVREETGISRSAISVSSVAVDLATKIVNNLESCKMLVIGAGEAGRLVAKVAKERGVSQITVASRTQERASTLAASLGGVPITMNNLVEELSTANIVVACAGAPHRILGVRHVGEAMKNRSELPLVIIDIAVPRNVEPEVGQIDNVFLYNIDDLTKVSDINRQQREGEIQKAEEIIASEVDGFISGRRASGTRHVVSALMERAEDIRHQQLSRTMKKLRPMSDEEQYSLEAMTKSIVNKILHDPIQHLKQNTNSNYYAELVKELFQLKEKKNR